MINEFEGARMSLEAALIDAEQYRGEAEPAILADSEDMGDWNDKSSLLLGSAKMHLANRVMEVGDIHAWWLLDDRMDILIEPQLCECAVDFGADLTGENAQPCGKDVVPGTRFCKNHSECGE